MLSDKHLFIAASLAAIGILILIKFATYITFLKNYSSSRADKFIRRLLWGCWLVLFGTTVYVIVYVAFSLYRRASGDAALAVLTGAAFGTLTARFVWRLFGPRFLIVEAIIGAAVFVLLSIAYSLPVYHREFLTLLQNVGVSSVKTPIAELTFTERQTRRPLLSLGSQPTTASGGVPRPSDPTRGLEFLDQGASDNPAGTIDAGFLEKDRQYIDCFGPGEDKRSVYDIIDHAKILLHPMHNLAHCLRAYVRVVKDAQLLAIDLKPLLENLFRVESKSFAAVRDNPTSRKESPDQSWADWRGLDEKIVKIMIQINAQFGYEQDIKDSCDTQQIATTYPVDTVFTEYLPPWQPYVAIALSSLLMAHGSTDEGVDVLAKWLDFWACARGSHEGCEFTPRIETKGLPEWLSFRAEFQMNVLLYQLVGSNNVIYRDFLIEHAGKFKDFASRHGEGVALNDQLKECEKRVTKDKLWSEWHVRVLQLLLDDENYVLLTERNFLFESDIADLENIYERAKNLARFTPDCIEPREAEAGAREKWKPVAAEYRITGGLLGTAVAERMSRIADSAYDRRRADEIRKESRTNLREGYRTLKEIRDGYRANLPQRLLSERVFATFGQEEAYSSAGQAIEQLNAAEP